MLPPYTELIRFDAGPRLQGEELRVAARGILRGHLDRMVPGNPFDGFEARLVSTCRPSWRATPPCTTPTRSRPSGWPAPASKLLGSHVEWLLGDGGDRSVAAMARIVEGCKMLGFKLARRRMFDPTEAMHALGQAWTEAMGSLDDALI